ncbi:MAG TPA: flagellar hook assembly protein FlgD [Noviherbaspirillum sp.]|nr:flagellar hook assembly protein FlgD [Noviherbaspirillum sp.]
MTSVQTVSPDLLGAMNASRKSEASIAEEAQNRFMTLLVTQMRNQDPLNPLDNAQVTSQLAQLSTVTGIDKLNLTLQSLQASYMASQSMQAANMIGHGVLVPGDTMLLVEGKGLMGVELPEAADSVVVTIRDASGRAVHALDLGAQKAGNVPFGWDGVKQDGTQAGDGVYTFEVTAMRGEQKVEAKALAFGIVSSVSTGAKGVTLNVSGLGSLQMSDVREIL